MSLDNLVGKTLETIEPDASAEAWGQALLFTCEM